MASERRLLGNIWLADELGIPPTLPPGLPVVRGGDELAPYLNGDESGKELVKTLTTDCLQQD